MKTGDEINDKYKKDLIKLCELYGITEHEYNASIKAVTYENQQNKKYLTFTN